MYFFCYTANPIIILPAVETARTNRTIAQLHMPLSSSKLNLIKSFVRKKFLDTSIFKSYKFDKEISNSIQGINNNNDNNVVHRKSIALPILISNQSKYYKRCGMENFNKGKIFYHEQ
ncbi:uncharacterized protein OCT59_023667 [Rhizophagus irregularis]|uniref:uncharacterized protein n=1 Tax=Rhizophagus irregularis TaxID=588596 RepID=UPI0019EBC90C|nr:hypothetical protein OCT59_023667 [Rhizophagus irregularis]GET58340.1 hypothetical protein RIR_jg39578.t1 [Rhizophagus irregularis DAOM 181602=DAOM 197198]